MFQGKEEIRHSRSTGSEVGFTDIAHFLKLNKIFIPLVTVALSLLLFTASFLIPQQYDKKLTYSIELTQNVTNAESVNPSQAVGYSAVDILENADFSRVAVSSRYVASEQHIEAFIQSQSGDLLKKTDSRVTALLKTKLQEKYGGKRRFDELDREPVSIAVVSSSNIDQSRPNAIIGGLALLSGFVIASGLALLRTALSQNR